MFKRETIKKVSLFLLIDSGKKVRESKGENDCLVPKGKE